MSTFKQAKHMYLHQCDLTKNTKKSFQGTIKTVQQGKHPFSHTQCFFVLDSLQRWFLNLCVFVCILSYSSQSHRTLVLFIPGIYIPFTSGQLSVHQSTVASKPKCLVVCGQTRSLSTCACERERHRQGDETDWINALCTALQ